MKIISVTSILTALVVCLAPQSFAEPKTKRGSDPLLLGYIEDAHVGKLGLTMKAKLDTGADTSSLYARNVQVYKKSGKNSWVKFRVIGQNGRSIRYDQNVVSFVAIKLKTGGTQRRPVIYLPLCVGGVSGLAEFTLADREHFDYQVLIGREFLASRIIVDSAHTFAAEESCEPVDRE